MSPDECRDIEWRDAFFAHLERTEEIMAGDPDHSPAAARQLARQHASRFTLGNPVNTGDQMLEKPA